MPPACCAGYRRIDSLLSILTWYGRKQGNGGTRTLRNQIPGYDLSRPGNWTALFSWVASFGLPAFFETSVFRGPAFRGRALLRNCRCLPSRATCNPNPAIPKTGNGGRDTRRPSGSAAIGASAASSRSLRERVGALRNLRPFLMMVWRTSPGLTAASLVLRLVRAVMPVVTLYVGKLIIDNVVLLMQAPHKPERCGCGSTAAFELAGHIAAGRIRARRAGGHSWARRVVDR